MNTAIIITGMICLTLIVIVWLAIGYAPVIPSEIEEEARRLVHHSAIVDGRAYVDPEDLEALKAAIEDRDTAKYDGDTL